MKYEFSVELFKSHSGGPDFIRFSDFQELVGHENSLGARAQSLI